MVLAVNTSRYIDLQDVCAFCGPEFAPTGIKAGLLVDVSKDGIQIISDKLCNLDSALYKITIHQSINHAEQACVIKRKWSWREGDKYLRHGFVCQRHSANNFLKELDLARLAGNDWLRCELVAIDDAYGAGNRKRREKRTSDSAVSDSDLLRYKSHTEMIFRIVKELDAKILRHPTTSLWPLKDRAHYIAKKMADGLNRRKPNGEPYLASTIRKIISGKVAQDDLLMERFSKR